MAVLIVPVMNQLADHGSSLKGVQGIKPLPAARGRGLHQLEGLPKKQLHFDAIADFGLYI